MYTPDDLEREFILTIQNEGEWYKGAYDLCQDHRFVAFSNLTIKFVERSRIFSNLKPLRLNEKAYITIKLWEDLGGKLTLEGPTFVAWKRWYEEYKVSHQKICTQPEITIEKEPIMSNQTAFETKSYVFGTDVSTMSEEQLIDSIKKVEKEISNLKEVKTQSKKITAKIADLEGMLTSIVTVLDKE